MTGRSFRGIWHLLLPAALGFWAAVTTLPHGIEAITFRIVGADAARENLETVIARFNKYFALYFDTAGDTMDLSTFPAGNPVKRRIYQDIATWRARGLAFMHDSFGYEISRLELLSPGNAVVDTTEHWVTWVRDLETGDKQGSRSNQIQVRYFLSRVEGNWEVRDFQVYGAGERLPPVPR